MSQNDMVIANQSFPSFRSDLNNALGALAGLSSGATAPSTTFAYQLWADTTTGILKQRNAADSAWISLFSMAEGKVLTQNGAPIYAADAGSNDTYVITLSPAPTAYTAGMVINFKANTINTGAATLNVNSLGAKTIKKNYNTDLVDGDIKAGQLVSVIYDGTNLQMISPVSIAGGRGVLLQTQEASTSPSIVFNSTYLTSTYKKYIWELIDVIGATDNIQMTAVVSEDNGSTYKTTAGNYAIASYYTSSATAVSSKSGTNETSLDLTSGAAWPGNTAGESINLTLELFNPSGTVNTKLFNLVAKYVNSSGNAEHIDGTLHYKATTNAINNVKFLMASGNITSGTFNLYGVI